MDALKLERERDAAIAALSEEGRKRGQAEAERDAARAEVERLREALGVAVEYMKGLLEDGCPKCGGDCSSANPSVAFCPARELANDLRIATEALSTKGGE